MNIIKYKGENISTNSEAANLYNAKKFAELDWHLRKVHERWIKDSGLNPADWPQHPSIASAGDPTARKGGKTS